MPAKKPDSPLAAREQATTTATRDYSIAVLDRALDVLELIDSASSPLGATEIARHIGATKSATYRILVNLETRGYVAREDATARYVLGTRLAEFGLRAGSRTNLVQITHPHLEWLSRTFGETANLGVLEGTQVLYLDIVESRYDLRMAARVGARDEVYSTALGKAMLAFLSEEEIDRILDGPLQQKTHRTVTNAARIRLDLKDIRASGVASEFGENETAACCLGVPLFGPDDNVIGAISLAGPEGRMTATGIDRISESLRTTGQSVTKRLGGHWPGMAETDIQED